MAKKKINGTVPNSLPVRRLSHEPKDPKPPIDPYPNNSSYGVNPINITFNMGDEIFTLADLMYPTYGGMEKYPETVIKGVTFENLTGEDAGVFYLEDGSLNLENCTFRNNEARAPGSSNIVAVRSTLNITKVLFDRNQGSHGGAIYAKD